MLIKGLFALRVYDFLKKVHLYMSIQDYMAIRDLRVHRRSELLMTHTATQLSEKLYQDFLGFPRPETKKIINLR